MDSILLVYCITVWGIVGYAFISLIRSGNSNISIPTSLFWWAVAPVAFPIYCAIRIAS